MRISTYKFSVKYCVVDFDTKTAKDIDKQIQNLKNVYAKELLHCIYPLQMAFNVTAEYEDDDNMYVSIVCNKLVTEDVISTERLTKHLNEKFAKFADGLFELKNINITFIK